MIVEVTHSGTAYDIEVSSDKPNLVSVIVPEAIVIEIALQRDGKNGKGAYEIAVMNGFTGTKEDWTAALIPPPDYDYKLLYEISKL